MSTFVVSYCEPNQIVIKYIGISMGMGTNRIPMHRPVPMPRPRPLTPTLTQ